MASEKELEQLAIIRAAADADPLAVFNQLVELRKSGIDPVAAGIVPGNPVTKKVKDVTRWVKEQISGATAGASDWQTNVKNPSRNPVEAALAANDKRIERLQKSIAEKKWEKNLGKVTQSDINTVVDKLGSGVFSNGIEARTDKITKRVGELQPLVQDVSNTIQAMSDKTDADREKRLLTARKLMIEVGKKRAG